MKLCFLLSLGLAALLAAPAAADTIVLKNGRRIHARNVQETEDRVYYEIPAGRISLPKSIVERIERDGSGPDWTSRERARASELPVADLPALNDADVQRVVEGGEVNRSLLAELEREATTTGTEQARRRAAAAHALVARLEASRGNADRAARSLRRALSFEPNHPALLLNLAAVELERQRYTAALEALQPVLGHQQYAFEAFRLQGWVYYQREELDRALRAWRQALSLRPDPQLEAAVARVEREAQASEGLESRASGRFLLRYEQERLASPRLAASLLRALDRMYDRLASAFHLVPREPIVVLLYPDQTFYELTGMPPQVHGLYDGKVRLPVQGMTALTPQLEQVLEHELVHAFVYFKSRGRAPHWLQEGLAQYYAGQRPPLSPETFRPLFEPRDGTALARIEAAFLDLRQSSAAYAASWFVVDTLMRRYARGDMERLLEALGRGGSVPQALQSAYRLSLVDLDRRLYDALR